MNTSQKKREILDCLVENLRMFGLEKKIFMILNLLIYETVGSYLNK